MQLSKQASVGMRRPVSVAHSKRLVIVGAGKKQVTAQWLLSVALGLPLVISLILAHFIDRGSSVIPFCDSYQGASSSPQEEIYIGEWTLSR